MNSTIDILCKILSLIVFFCLTLFFSQKTYLHPQKPLVLLDSKFETHFSETRSFTGIPSIAVSQKRIWAVWYAGITPNEDYNNYVVVSSSLDGKIWDEEAIIDPDLGGPYRAFDPQIWYDPNGDIRVFWAQSIGYSGVNSFVWSITISKPDSSRPAWGQPKKISSGIMLGKPCLLSNKEWMLPISVKGINYSAKLFASKDSGESWYEKGAVNVPKESRNYDEHMIVELNQGTIWMLVRTTYGIGESMSYDFGATWSPLYPSKIKHSSARFFIGKLNSGNLLLVKHGNISSKVGRSDLKVFISENNGKSWLPGYSIDERDGVSYPDCQQEENGNIKLIYDYKRTEDKQIIVASFSETDILENSIIYSDQIKKTKNIIINDP